MNFDFLNDLARGNEEMPTGLTLPEQECFLALRHLYGSYRQRLFSQEQGNREKKAIRIAFQAAGKEYAKRDDNWKRDQERIKAASEQWSSIAVFARTATDAELIDRLLAIITAMVGEAVTAQAVRKARPRTEIEVKRL